MANNDNYERGDSKNAGYWLTPEQFQRLQSAAQKPSEMDHPKSDEPRTGWEHLNLRDEMMIQLMYDMGLRRAEVAGLKVKHVRLDADTPHIYLPAEIQRTPNRGRARSPARMKFSDADFLQTQQKLRIYLNARWKESDGLFPTQQGDQITPRTVARRVDAIADNADVQPYSVDGEKASSERITPHVFRHSVAYRMLVHQDGNTIYNVQKRLRHRQLATTQRIYDHFRMR